MGERNKWAFWTLAAAVLAVAATPSFILLSSFQRYYEFLTGYTPMTLRSSRMRRIPHRGPLTDAPERAAPNFVEFRISAPKAARVTLAGDFTQWNENRIPLSKRADGTWETVIPLPPGRYRYFFMIDGAPSLDPKNPAQDKIGPRDCSVRTVP